MLIIVQVIISELLPLEDSIKWSILAVAESAIVAFPTI